MKIEDTIFANIYVGLKEQYDGKIHSMDEVEKICQNYVDEAGLAVTLTKTKYIYTDGNELGVIIGLINYPRFPSNVETIYNHAISIAKILMDSLNQYRVTIVMNNKTYMLEQELD